MRDVRSPAEADASPSRRSLRDEEILAEIRRVRKGYAAVYGARRTGKELRRHGVEVARCTVQRLMTAAGMLGVARGRTPRTTTPDEAAAVDTPPDQRTRYRGSS